MVLPGVSGEPLVGPQAGLAQPKISVPPKRPSPLKWLRSNSHLLFRFFGFMLLSVCLWWYTRKQRAGKLCLFIGTKWVQPADKAEE